MASGEANPFTCNICLDDKVQKSPRVLHCLHSFCEACLHSWHTRRQSDGLDTKTQVECPVCRETTNLPQGGIAALPHDFRVKEFVNYLNTKSNTLLCQACCEDGQTSKAKVLCRTCNGRFCKTCGENHKRMALFSQHEISTAVCEMHGGALEFVCVTCVSGICVACVYSKSHRDHEIQAAELGLTKVKATFLNIKSDLYNAVSACDTDVKEKLQVCLDKQCESEKNMKEVGELIKKTVDNVVKEAIEDHKRQHKEALEKAFAEYEDKRTAPLIKDMENIFKSDREETLIQLGKLSILGKEFVDVVKILHRSLPEPTYIATSCCRLEGTEGIFEALKECKLVCGIAPALSKSSDISNPVLQKKIECTSGIEAPWNINVTQEGDIIVCSFYGGAVHKVRMSGEIEMLYNDKTVIASCVRDDCIFLLCKDGTNIVKLIQGRPSELFALKPVDQEPRGIAIEGSKAYILYRKGLMCHSLLKEESKWILQKENLYFHSFMLSSITGSRVLPVTDLEGSQVFVFDEFGEEIITFGGKEDKNCQFGSPDAITRMPNGNFLVADWSNRKIVEYGSDGVFVRNLLSGRDGLDHPTGVAIYYPYLWVTESITEDGKRKQSIKLFRFHP